VTGVVDGLVTMAVAASSPRGRQGYGRHQPTGRLSLERHPGGGVAWRITRTSDGVVVVAGRVGDPLNDRQLAVLAQLAMVATPTGERSTGEAAAPPEAWAQVLVQLAATGLVLDVAAPPGLLAPELTAVLQASLPARNADPLAWDVRSVRQRRAAWRGHGVGLAEPPAVSALLVTKRPQLVARAVATVAGQTYPNLEIVVAVHGPVAGAYETEHSWGQGGAGLREALAPSDLDAAGRPLRILSVPAARNLGEALSEASAAASGELLTKVDDDDRYGREHIWDLVLARHYTDATVVGKGSEFVYLEPKDLTVRRRMGAEFFTDTVAGGTIALSRDDLAAAGGWPPVPRWVDRALLDRVLAGGGRVYRTHPIGFVYTRHGEGHTWDADLAYFLPDPLRKWRGLPPYDEFDDAGAPRQARRGAGAPDHDRGDGTAK
jgi:hypothetical protein